MLIAYYYKFAVYLVTYIYRYIKHAAIGADAHWARLETA